MATDPRARIPVEGERSVLPVVAPPRRGAPGWVIGVGAGVAALLLFGALDARRRALEAPPASVRAIDAAGLAPAPPPLDLPAEPAPVEPMVAPIVVSTPPPVVRPAPLPAPTPQRIIGAPQPFQVATIPTQPTRPLSSTGAALVVDNSTPRTAPANQNGSPPNPANLPGGVASTDRARASMFANRSTTVPQGTLIPAVLETAFDSTRAGFARAIVSRDVVGFDGTRVLIPRGSRLIGQYQSDAAPGQKRALVIWSRLIRPDGAVIAIGSPAADPVGRGGVRADVNSHFFERFAGAILQSALDVGVNLASRAGNGSVIVALPGTAQSGAGQLIRPTTIPPTLSVRPGTSVSVFVARDLDFTDVEVPR